MTQLIYMARYSMRFFAIIFGSLVIISCSSLNYQSQSNMGTNDQVTTSSIQNVRDNTIQKTVVWFTTGQIDPNILANNFLFKSPYYKDKDKTAFINEFNNTTFYQKQVLAKIKKFDPLITLKSGDGNYFAIITEYHTYSGHSVYETVLGKLNNAGLLVELRSIYDLQETKQAFQL